MQTLNNMRDISSLIFIIFLVTSCSSLKTTSELVIKKYDNGVIKERGALINNKKNGYWAFYDKEGNLSIEEIYINGKANGAVKIYYYNGNISVIFQIKNGHITGEWISYFENGNIESRGEFKNDERIGIWYYYIEDGRLNEKIKYKDGKSIILINNKLEPPVPFMLKY